MDILETLRTKIISTGEGEHSSGLCAVLLHIETAFAHLSRGQSQQDETAFTDAIYRSNQAFEGSIKEAYRVLTSKDPNKKRPHDIEKYLEDNDILSPRVLSQFTTYRTEWRNPSTHDYMLDFDESEAFLAIINVTAFACLLIDQISEKQSFEKAKEKTDTHKETIRKRIPDNEKNVLEIAASLITEFIGQGVIEESGKPRKTEIQITGALCGFLAVTAPEIDVVVNFRLDPSRNERGDILLRKDDQQVLIELKRSPKSRNILDSGLIQLEHYLDVSGLSEGLLFLYEQGITEVQRKDFAFPDSNKVIIALIPKEGSKGVTLD